MADVEVIVIGSGTCVPRRERAGPATVIKMDGVTILVDSAAGTLRRLEQNGIPWTSVDYVFYTHFHPDHVAELVPLIFATKYAPGFDRKGPIRVFGPEGLVELHSHLRAAFGQWVEPEPDKIVLEEIPVSMPARLQLPPIEVRSIHVRHTDKSLAYRFTSRSGTSVVVSGDTDYCEEIVELGRDAHLLILECSMPDHSPVEGHLTPSKVRRIASESKAKRALLTHFYPEMERTFQNFAEASTLIAARDGMVVIL